MDYIKVERTKKGHPALWEKGGGMTKTGHAQLIAGPNGESKKPVYIRRRGHLACGEHALFIVSSGDLIIRADHHRRDFDIIIMQIVSIHEDNKAIVKKLYQFSKGEWNEEPPEELQAVIEAAKEKATCYHCRRPHYIKEEDEKE